MIKTTDNKGYTLVELVIVMAIFIVIIIIASLAFENILRRSGQQGKIAQSSIDGIVGLEMMRHDIANTGYGLYWSFPPIDNSGNNVDPVSVSIFKTEVDESPPNVEIDAIDAKTFNDDLTKTAPRAILSGTGTSKIDYLVVKGTIVGMSPTSRRWNNLVYAENNNSYIIKKGDADTDLAKDDRVITLKSKFTTQGAQTKQLIVDPVNKAFSYTVPDPTTPTTFVLGLPLKAFQPGDDTQKFIAYGINHTGDSTELRVPYNRVDFYVDKKADKPAGCNQGTGVLFKAVAVQDGKFQRPYPLLDCVGDMQVVYYQDKDKNGNLEPLDESYIINKPMSADDIHSLIKKAQVFILTHEGKKDTSFSYPVTDPQKVICVAPYSGSTCLDALGRMWSQDDMNKTFGNDWRNYRWKVFYFNVSFTNLQ